MESQDQKNTPQVAVNQDYDVNHPENLNTPSYNSTKEYREGNELPGVENLNHENGLNDPLKESEIAKNQPSSPKNDASMHGEKSKTDLGNGTKTEEEKENEKIIRT